MLRKWAYLEAQLIPNIIYSRDVGLASGPVMVVDPSPCDDSSLADILQSFWKKVNRLIGHHSAVRFRTAFADDLCRYFIMFALLGAVSSNNLQCYVNRRVLGMEMHPVRVDGCKTCLDIEKFTRRRDPFRKLAIKFWTRWQFFGW